MSSGEADTKRIKLASWVRAAQPYLMLFVSAVAIPTSIASFTYLLSHRDSHIVIDSFIGEGGRVYSSDGLPISTDQMQERFRVMVDERIDEKVPPPEVLEALERIGDLREEVGQIQVSIGRLETGQDALLRSVARIESNR